MSELFNYCAKGDFKTLKNLLESREDLEKLSGRSNSEGQTLLFLACYHGHLNIVKYLLTISYFMENSPSIKDINGHSPLHAACQNGHLKIVIYLLTYSSIRSELYMELQDIEEYYNDVQDNIAEEYWRYGWTTSYDDYRYDTLGLNGETTPLGIAVIRTQPTDVRNGILLVDSDMKSRQPNYIKIVKLLIYYGAIIYPEMEDLNNKWIKMYIYDPFIIYQWIHEIFDDNVRLFIMVVGLSDGFFTIKSVNDETHVVRFLNIIENLPIEVQKIICNYTYGFYKQSITSSEVNTYMEEVLS